MRIKQLKIDIQTDEIDSRMYEEICKVINKWGCVVMDDGHAPYVEDITEEYYKYEK